ncbi:MAG: taurine dioxygenase [Alphaproteobacteria bacterium]|nr:taurine dioxygenase [Alphaproteobacteria bacterium]
MDDAAPGFRVRPFTGALGAEIEGVDLSRPLDPAAFAAIHRAFLAHGVIFFRDQTLTPATQTAFAARFGKVEPHPMIKPRYGEHPEVVAIVKEPHERHNFGGQWHSDVTYTEKPALGSVLYAIDIPARGGDTLFANQYLAYETLSPGMQAMLGRMIAVHSSSRSYGDGGREGGYVGGADSMPVAHPEKIGKEFEHPVVRTHPETGRKALYVNEVFTIRFQGWTEAESAPLLDYLWRHSTRPEFGCRFSWTKGAVAVWDNRCVQHLALNDYHGFRREMHRVSVGGAKPY